MFFITILRSMAACLITNAHYTGIYPSDLLANGGLIGDILFFAVSGYCLFNIKTSFPKWYGKRIYRVYLPVLVITFVYFVLGFYSFDKHNFLWWFVYPTYYHFVASIIVLYIPFYFICKIDFLRKRIPIIMLIIFLFAFVYYIFFYDKSYYHIDTVRESFVRVLFMESMLLGAFFKQKDYKFRNNKNKITIYLILTILFFFIYFASKLFFSKFKNYSEFQIINQFIIFIFLYFIFRVFAAYDNTLEKIPCWFKKIIDFVSNLTLEIYLVQYVVIDLIRDLSLKFPLNWFVVTVSILVCALLLHLICKFLYKLFNSFYLKAKKQEI